jgi:hypothetical protein
MARAQSTTDHDVIRRWIESRQGHPSVVRATEGRGRGGAGLLRVDFGPAEDGLHEIGWDEFFETFDSNDLTFLFQDSTSDGGESRFHKFVRRDADSDDSEGAQTASSKSRAQLSLKNKGNARSAQATSGGTRAATPQEEEEFEEIDEDELDELDEDEDSDADDDADLEDIDDDADASSDVETDEKANKGKSQPRKRSR